MSTIVLVIAGLLLLGALPTWPTADPGATARPGA